MTGQKTADGRLVRFATRRLLSLPIDHAPLGSVAYWDGQTSAADARIGLCLALGARPEQISADATWTPPRPAVQLDLFSEVAA